MFSSYIKPKNWFVGLGLWLGSQAYAGTIEGRLCFIQPQIPGPVREEQIISFEVLNIGTVSHTNIQQKGEKLSQYLRRMNEPLRTIAPETFQNIEKDITHLKGVEISDAWPILVNEYKAWNFTIKSPCYFVPLAHTIKESNKDFKVIFEPFTNLKKLSTHKSALLWFILSAKNNWSLNNYLSVRDSGFKKSPTAKLVLDQIFYNAANINLKTIENLCTQPELALNMLCRGNKGVINSSEELVQIYRSEIIKKCIEEQGGVLSDENQFNYCLDQARSNLTFGKSIAKTYKDIGNEIPKGEENTVNGLFQLIVLAPLHPVAWLEENHQAQEKLKELSNNLEKIPLKDFFQLKNTLINNRSSMILELKMEQDKVNKFISQSNLSAEQKAVLSKAAFNLVESGLPFANIELSTENYKSKKQSAYNKVYNDVGFQYIWP